MQAIMAYELLIRIFFVCLTAHGLERSALTPRLMMQLGLGGAISYGDAAFTGFCLTKHVKTSLRK